MWDCRCRREAVGRASGASGKRSGPAACPPPLAAAADPPVTGAHKHSLRIRLNFIWQFCVFLFFFFTIKLQQEVHVVVLILPFCTYLVLSYPLQLRRSPQR